MKKSSRVHRPFPTNAMRVRVYDVLSECVEQGIQFGLNRMEKYAITERDGMAEHLHREIMVAVCQKFQFDEEAP